MSPEAESIEVSRLWTDGHERVGLDGQGDMVRAEVLPDPMLTVDAIFAWTLSRPRLGRLAQRDQG